MNAIVPAILPSRAHGSQKADAELLPRRVVDERERAHVVVPGDPARTLFDAERPKTSRTRSNIPAATASSGRYGRSAPPSAPSARVRVWIARYWSHCRYSSPSSSSASTAVAASRNAAAADAAGPASSASDARAPSTDPSAP